LAVYKAFFGMGQASLAEPIDDAEAGTCRFSLLAGAGLGDKATGDITGTIATNAMTQDNLVACGDFYGPKSMVANANTTCSMINGTPDSLYVSPSTEVPYVIVRDNVCLVYEVGDNFTSNATLSVRLEVAQVTLDQATLNQLLRTQTV